MLVPFLKCKLRNDGNTRVNLSIPPQELALLVEQKGESAFTDIEPSDDIRDMDPVEEYERLEHKYGNKPDSDRSWVEIAFGSRYSGGIATIMENGAKHYAPELAEKPKTKRKRPSRSKAAVAARAAEAENGQDAAAA